MSATVAAALKKIAVAILTDKKLRKAVFGIVLGIIIIVIMPAVAVIALFNGDINIDTDRLQQIVVEEMSDEEKAKLQAVEDTMKDIESAMTEKGFTAERTKEAQVLYVLALSDYAEQTDFVSKLAGCFAEDQTDEQLIAAVNAAFGTELKTEDYSKIMNSIRAKAINVSKFVDPETKNNVDLAEGKAGIRKEMGLCIRDIRRGAERIHTHDKNVAIPGTGRRERGIHSSALARRPHRRLHRAHQRLCMV